MTSLWKEPVDIMLMGDNPEEIAQMLAIVGVEFTNPITVAPIAMYMSHAVISSYTNEFLETDDIYDVTREMGKVCAELLLMWLAGEVVGLTGEGLSKIGSLLKNTTKLKELGQTGKFVLDNRGLANLAELKALLSKMNPEEITIFCKKFMTEDAYAEYLKLGGAADTELAGLLSKIAEVTGKKKLTEFDIRNIMRMKKEGFNETKILKCINGTSEVPIWNGSGPAPGVLGVNGNCTSIKAIENYYPKEGHIEFVFDTQTNTFVVGKPKVEGLGYGSPHERLADTINAAGAYSETTVGGKFSRGTKGEILTNEDSGHFGEAWTPEIRKQFVETMKSYGLDVTHTIW